VIVSLKWNILILKICLAVGKNQNSQFDVRFSGIEENPNRGNDYKELIINFYLLNNGRGIATYPYVSVKVNSPFFLSDNVAFGKCGLPVLLTGGWLSNSDTYKIFGGNINNVIHPGTSLFVSEIRGVISLIKDADSNIEYKICAENMQMIEDQKVIAAEDIHKYINLGPLNMAESSLIW
jgi:hypothetical protein